MGQAWWKDKIVYQIYPKSFYDSNGDGIGDLRGVILKLDYIRKLGIDLIWLSPVYPSPFVDQGYDISDYYSIGKDFGTMEDFDELVAEAKKRDMGIVMDLVVNHCSDQHEWFQKALKDPYGKYGGYFYFVRGKDGKRPNNARSYFGGSAWDKVPGTDLYYLHMFSKEQPDLNWENPEVRGKIYEMINWWLDKGIAGFRIDAIINIKKDTTFPSFSPDGPDGLCNGVKMIESASGIGEFLSEMKERAFAPHGAFTVGEVFNVKEEELEDFIGEDGYFSTMFDFAPHIMSQGEHGFYDAKPVEFEEWKRTLIRSQTKAQERLFYANIIENHDEPRGASRYLPEYAQTPEGVMMLGTVSVLLRGIPVLYQGQEIGMRNCLMESIDDYDDLDTKNQYRMALAAGLSEEEALRACARHSRDNARTPMQWSAGVNAGFTEGTPWLRVNGNYTEINVEAQEADESSVLNYYRRLIALRKGGEWKDVFVNGAFVPAYEEAQGVMAFYRQTKEKKALVLANFGEGDAELALPHAPARLLLCNMAGTRERYCNKEISLRPCEAAVLEMP